MTLAPAAAAADGAVRNADHVALELRRMRLLARRRALWLRARFRDDPLADFGRAVTSDARADVLLGGDEHANAATFYRSDPDALAIATLLDELEDQLAALRDQRASPLSATVALFELTGFERDVLLLALAPELDAGFARACGYLTDDATRRLPTMRLVLDLLPGARAGESPGPAERAARAAALGPGGRLRRLHLIELGDPALEPQADRTLRLDERVAGHLRGYSGLDARVAALARSPEVAPLGERSMALVEQLATVLERRDAAEPLPLVNLVARPGAGAAAIAAATCRRVGLGLVVLDAAALATAAAGDTAIGPIVERESLLGARAFAVDATAAARDEVAELERLLDALGVPVFVISEWRWASRRRLLAVDVPWPTPRERAALLGAAVGDASLPGLGQIAEHFQIGPADVAEAAGGARELAALRGARATAADLWRSCRARASHEIAAQTDRIEVVHQWDDIVLPPEALTQLHEIAAQAKDRARVYGDWGFGAKLGRGRGIAALFAGPSGTGKTLAAEILAGAVDLELYRVDLARVVSKYVGETEKNLRQVVRAAERAGAMLLFDEADALFAGRTEVHDSRDRYANLQVDYLLQLMEGFRGVAVLATNRRGTIDSAFLRRLRFVIDFPLQDAPAREAIWRRSFASGAPLAAIDWEALGALELSGGSIRTVALNAAFLAVADDTAIGMRHVMRAARREYHKLDRLAADVDFASWEGEAVPA